jgi:hypothetical protein
MVRALSVSTNTWASITLSMLDDRPVFEVTTTLGVFTNRELICREPNMQHVIKLPSNQPQALPQLLVYRVWGSISMLD